MWRISESFCELIFLQVYDLRERTPDKVLHQLYSNLEKHKQNGDSLSLEIEKRLRIIVSPVSSLLVLMTCSVMCILYRLGKIGCRGGWNSRLASGSGFRS